ncbi:hypothetical protein LINPERHAP1_LOCUS34378 [Linum perenne]
MVHYRICHLPRLQHYLLVKPEIEDGLALLHRS